MYTQNTALLAACKTTEVVIEHVTGHPPTVADALLAMCAQAEAAGSRRNARRGGTQTSLPDALSLTDACRDGT